MQRNNGKRRLILWAGRFAALCAVLATVGGSAAADPTLVVLHSFTGSDGARPQAGLIADSDGNLYGTTQGGGATENGVVFKLAPDGTYTVLYSFTSKDRAVAKARMLV